MRRALLVVLAGGLLLPVAACDNAKKSSAAPAVSVAPPVSLPPLPDYTVNTQMVCTRLQAVYTGELREFGTAMGKLVSLKEAKQTADAAKAETQVAGKLKAAGAKIRQDTETAEDPGFRAAGETSAAKFEQSATDRKYVDRVKTLKDLNSTLRPQMAQWLTPVSSFCESTS
ncbi:MAG TPA: hypothetical protein VGD29_04235 [Actinoplanes sp.]